MNGQAQAVYEIGKFYRVPTVWGYNHGYTGNWPVLGPKHEDREIIEFDDHHYHIDWRFVDIEFFEAISRRFERAMPYGIQHLYGIVLLDIKGYPLGPVVYRRVKCKRDFPAFPAEVQWLAALEMAYAKAQLTDDLICPHRGAPLASVPADEAGCVTCPLHGLRWNLETRRLCPGD